MIVLSSVSVLLIENHSSIHKLNVYLTIIVIYIKYVSRAQTVKHVNENKNINKNKKNINLLIITIYINGEV